MNTHGIHVLYGTNDDNVICLVPHHFKFIFFPAEQTSFEHNLGVEREVKSCRTETFKFLAVIGNAASCAPQGKAGTDNNRETYLVDSGFCLFKGMDNSTFRNLETDFVHGLAEGVPPFCFFNDIDISAKQLNIIFVENACFSYLYGSIKPCLSAKSWEKSIRTLTFNNFGNEFRSNRLDICAIRNFRIGHDCRRVGVDENYLIPFFFQCFDRLGSGVVKFAGLADDNGTRADNQNLFDVSSFGHCN